MNQKTTQPKIPDWVYGVLCVPVFLGLFLMFLHAWSAQS